MRILLASSSSGSKGGGEIALAYLGKSLRDLGHTVGLWASDHERMTPLAERFSSIGEVIRAPYVNTYDLRGRSLSSYWNTANRRSAEHSWRRWQPDVVHINKQNLEDGLDLLSAANRCEVPNLCFIHITQTAKYLKAINARLRDWVARRALHQYSSIIATCGDTRQKDLQSFTGWSNERVRCIYNGTPDPKNAIDPSWRQSHREKLGIRDHEILVTMSARLTAQKDPMKFLRLAEATHRANPRTRFLWVGPGDLANEWDAHVDERRMKGYVHRLGWQEDTKPWLAASDCYLHTAAYEGLPLAILEAMSMGLPCYLTQTLIDQIGAFTEHDIGVIEAPQSLAHELDDQQSLNELGHRARGLYEKHFRAEVMAQKFVDLYSSLDN